MLFLQGTRDELADQTLLSRLIEKLGTRAVLELFPEADHSFHAPSRSGHTDRGNIARISELIATWIETAILDGKASS